MAKVTCYESGIGDVSKTKIQRLINTGEYIRYYRNDHIQDMIIIDNTKVILSNEIFYYGFQVTRGCIKNIDRVMETTKLCIQNI